VAFSSKNLTVFYAHLATMLDAGLPIERALSTLIKTSPRAMHASINELIQTVRRGAPLSEGLLTCGKNFPEIDRQTLVICEKSGSIERGLASLADYHEKKMQARNKVISSSTYPFLLLVVGIFISRVPDLILGWMGKINYTMFNYLRDTLGVLILFALFVYLIVWLFRTGFKVPGLNVTLDKIVRFIPGYGSFQMDYTLSRWTSCIRLMLNAGYGVVEALDISTKLVASPMIAYAYSKAKPLINNPMNVSRAFEETGLFRPILVQFWSTGEESGKIDDMLVKLTEHFEYEWRRSLDNLTAWIPRILYAVILLILAMQILRMAAEIAGSYQSIIE
jgi:type II secretory pathway component PulF